MIYFFIETYPVLVEMKLEVGTGTKESHAHSRVLDTWSNFELAHNVFEECLHMLMEEFWPDGRRCVNQKQQVCRLFAGFVFAVFGGLS